MQCQLIKYIVACTIESKDAKTVAKALIEQIILKYGLFNILKTDRGTEFTNELMREIFVLLKIKQNVSIIYHHQTLCRIDRNHCVLKRQTNLMKTYFTIYKFTKCNNCTFHKV